MKAGHPLARRLGLIVVTIVVALGGMIALLLYFNGRDDAGVASQKGPGQAFADQGAAHLNPGQRPPRPYDSSPPTSGAHVPVLPPGENAQISNDQLLHAIELGNVVLLYGGDTPPPALRAMATDVAGPFDRVLLEGGQMIVLARRPGTRGVVAVAWRHRLRVAHPADPVLREFADYWLGRGAGAS